ncbi:MAG: twin-arginine translocase TatA/TatE family subunit [Infirmifilum uzonense]|uniref:twin-arginine translocase TatA/TatE family subunit n=1 Tax=Infirmifilum uzonense TaxID=1550241 RepID=UPI003C7345F2
MFLLTVSTAEVFSIGLGPTEILLLILLAIILFAPRKIPELARAIKESAAIIKEEASTETSKDESQEKSEEELKKISEKLGVDKEEKKKRKIF